MVKIVISFVGLKPLVLKYLLVGTIKPYSKFSNKSTELVILLIIGDVDKFIVHCLVPYNIS